MSEEKTFELTPFQKMLVNACLCGDYLVMGTAFVDSGASLTKDVVMKSLVYLQARHPFLRAYLEIYKNENKILLKIHNEDVKDRIQLDWLDLTNETVTRSRLNDISAEYNSVLFNIGNKELLWRVQVIEYKENSKTRYIINLILHIAITDGFNITTMSIEMVNIINALLTNQVCDEMKITLEPIENLHALCEKTKLFKEEHKETIKKINAQEKVKFILDELFASTKETGFKLDLFPLEKELTKKIIEVSKPKNVKLTGYFHTVGIYALKKLYDENGLTFPKRISIELPASLRIRYPEILEYYHCGCHTVMVTYPTDETKFGEYKDFWADALYVHNSIYENTDAKTGSLFSMTHAEDLDEFNKVFSQTKNIQEACEILSKEVICCFATSNLGNYVDQRVKVYPGPVTIDELYCTDPLNSSPTIAPAIVIHLFYWKGRVMVELGGNKSCIGSKYLERFKELYLETIQNSLNA